MDIDETESDLLNNSDSDCDESMLDENKIAAVIDEDTEDYCEEQSEEESDAEASVPQDDYNATASTFTAKSGRTWLINPPPRSKLLPENPLTRNSGPTQYTNCATTHAEFLEHFIIAEMKKDILRFLKEESKNFTVLYNKQHPAIKKTWIDFSEIKLDVFIGVLLLLGALPCRKEKISDIWSTDESIRRNIFTAFLSRDRFKQFLLFIRFDDKSTRVER